VAVQSKVKETGAQTPHDVTRGVSAGPFLSIYGRPLPPFLISTFTEFNVVAMAGEHFRFLDLPAELRVMVYEHLDIVTRLHTIEVLCPGEWPEVRKDPRPTITIKIKSVPGQNILATCRAVFDEAFPILSPKLQQVREFEPVRLIMDTLSFRDLFGSPLRHALSPNTYKYNEDAGCYQYGKLPIDITDRKTFDFVRQCGNYMRWNRSRELIVTIMPHTYDYSSHRFCWIGLFEEVLERPLGILNIRVGFYDFKEEALDEIRNGFWSRPCRVIEEAEWTELWANEQVIGFDR
jgi:hypothetical protein